MNEEFQLTICNVNMLVKKFLKESPVLYKRFNGRYEVESVSLLDESVKYYYCPTYNEIWLQKLSVTLINTENGTKLTCKFNGKIDLFPILIVKDNSGLGGAAYYSKENGRSLVVLEDIEYKFVPVNVIVKLRDFQGAVVAIERLETFGDPEITGNTYVYTTKTVCVSGQYHIWIKIIVQDAEIYEKYSYTVNYMDPDTLNYVSRTYNVTTSPIDIKVPYVVDDITITVEATELPKTYLSLRTFGNISIADFNNFDSRFNIDNDVKYVTEDIGYDVNEYGPLYVVYDTSVYDKLICTFYQNGELTTDNMIMFSCSSDNSNPMTMVLVWKMTETGPAQTRVPTQAVGSASATWEEFGDRVVSYINPNDGDVFLSGTNDYDIYIYHADTKTWVGKNINLGDALLYKKYAYIKVSEITIYEDDHGTVWTHDRWRVEDKMSFLYLISSVPGSDQKKLPAGYLLYYLGVLNLSSIAHNLLRLQVLLNNHKPTVTVNIYNYIGVDIIIYDDEHPFPDGKRTTLFTTEPDKDYSFSSLKQSAEYKLNDICGYINIELHNMPQLTDIIKNWFYKKNNIMYGYFELTDTGICTIDELRITTDTTIDIFVNKIVGIDMLMNTNDTNLELRDVIKTTSLYPLGDLVEWNETYTTKVIDGSIDRWKFRIWKKESPFTRIAPQIQIFKNSKPLERVWPEVYPTYYDFNEDGYVDIPALETYINEDREVIAITDNVDASVTGDNIEILPSIKSYVMTFTGLYKFRRKKVIFTLSWENDNFYPEDDDGFYPDYYVEDNKIKLSDFEISADGMTPVVLPNEEYPDYNSWPISKIDTTYSKKMRWEFDLPTYQYYITINIVFPNKNIPEEDEYVDYDEPTYDNYSYYCMLNGVKYNYKSYYNDEESTDIEPISIDNSALMDTDSKIITVKIPITRFRDSVNDDDVIEINATRETVQLYDVTLYPDLNTHSNVLIVRNVDVDDESFKKDKINPDSTDSDVTIRTLMKHPKSLKIELTSKELSKCPTGHLVYSLGNNIVLDAIVAYPYMLYVNESNYKTYFSNDTARLRVTSIVRSYYMEFSMPDDGHDVIVKNPTYERDELLNNHAFPRKNGYFYSMYQTPETTHNSIEIYVDVPPENADTCINAEIYCANNVDDLYDYPVLYTKAKYYMREKYIEWVVGDVLAGGEQYHTTIPFEDAVWRIHFFTTDE